MTRETKIVWTTRGGEQELLVKKSPTEWYVPLSTINLETLEELALATADAVKEYRKELSKV